MICTESKMKNLSEPSSRMAVQDQIGAAWHIDLHQLKSPSLGGNTQLLILVFNNPGVVRVIPMKWKTAECIKEALMENIAEVKANGYKITKYIMDHEATLIATKTFLGMEGIKSVVLPAGMHNKVLERMVTDIKARVRCLKNTLTYKLPEYFEAEVYIAAARAISCVPNIKSGYKTTPEALFTGVRPVIPPFNFGQPELTYSKRKDNPEVRTEMAIFLGIEGNQPQNIRVYVPSRSAVYSRRPTRTNSTANAAPAIGVPNTEPKPPAMPARRMGRRDWRESPAR
jgi:hypothetical protein